MSISGSVIYGMTHITLGFKFCHQGFNQHHMFINGCVWVLVHVGLLFLARFSCCSCVVLRSQLSSIVGFADAACRARAVSGRLLF